MPSLVSYPYPIKVSLYQMQLNVTITILWHFHNIVDEWYFVPTVRTNHAAKLRHSVFMLLWLVLL